MAAMRIQPLWPLEAMLRVASMFRRVPALQAARAATDVELGRRLVMVVWPVLQPQAVTAVLVIPQSQPAQPVVPAVMVMMVRMVARVPMVLW